MENKQGNNKVDKNNSGQGLDRKIGSSENRKIDLSTSERRTTNDKRIAGRFAPTPSGHMHVGNARTALVAWLSARSKGGRFIWRLEDLDTPRIIEGAAEQAKRDMAWLGLDWDEGGDEGGDYGPYVQSERSERYERALDVLYERGRIFPCSYSRKELRSIASAPHVLGSSTYPAELRPSSLSDEWYDEFRNSEEGRDVALRFMVDSGLCLFEDLVFGSISSDVAQETGDFVLKRRDGVYAYQLAVVVDDIEMGITEVVRGADLLSSTARQILLIRALGGELPSYAHLPLLLDHEGNKLSKRNQDLEIRYLSSQGYKPEKLVGEFMYGLQQIDQPEDMSCLEALAVFDPSKIGQEDQIWP